LFNGLSRLKTGLTGLHVGWSRRPR